VTYHCILVCPVFIKKLVAMAVCVSVYHIMLYMLQKKQFSLKLVMLLTMPMCRKFPVMHELRVVC